MKQEGCTCPGWKWAEYAEGPRGGRYPRCQRCGRAICPGENPWIYFHARADHKCYCERPAYPEKVPFHQVWCQVNKSEMP